MREESNIATKPTANPFDVLVVETFMERFGYPEFGSGQIVPLGQVHNLMKDRSVRYAWVTDMAFREMRLDEEVAIMHCSTAAIPARAFRPKQPSLLARLRAAVGL